MRQSRALIVLAALALVAGSAFAQPSFSPAQSASSPGGGIPNPGPACGPITMTQSATQNIVALNSVSCNAGGLHTDNFYYRSFDPANFGVMADFNVCAVEIGIETATGPGGVQPADFNVYTGPPGFPTNFPASYTLVGTANLSVADQTLSILNAAVAAAIPAGDHIVLEFFTPNGQATGASLFVGSNPDGQTGPSYLAAADCGVATPTDTAAIGFPTMHIVMNVIGDLAIIENPPVPTLGEWGLLALILLLAGAATFMLRRS